VLRADLDTAPKLANSGKANATWQRELAVSDDNIAAVLFNEGKLNEALASYMEGLAIRQMLTEKDKTNTESQRDLSVIHDNIGYILFNEGKLDEALRAYNDSLAIIRTLAQMDEANASWQRDLSVNLRRRCATH
jgi:tetratricopeptide (TPR) repeat protein